jgi:hypothetical protein
MQKISPFPQQNAQFHKGGYEGRNNSIDPQSPLAIKTTQNSGMKINANVTPLKGLK